MAVTSGLVEGVDVRGGKMEGGEACLPVEESAEERVRSLGPRGGVGIRAWAGCGHFEAVSRGFGRCLFNLWLFLVSAKLLQR